MRTRHERSVVGAAVVSAAVVVLSPVVLPPAALAAGGNAGLPGGPAVSRSPMVRLFESCRHSVVTVTAKRKETKAGCSSSGRRGRGATVVTRTEQGSGSVIHPAGYVLTCSHELRHGGRLRVIFDDGRSFAASQVARDDVLDVALLRMDKPPDDLRPLKLARSGDLMVGQRVAALGNPSGFGLSLGVGYVTGLHRKTDTGFTLLTNAIQTDAGINPGMSGGPLVNMLGQVIGIGVSRRSDADGLGFVVAVDDIREHLGDMIDAEHRCGFVLGMAADGSDPPVVRSVRPGGPAAAAGVRAGDVIVGMNGSTVSQAVDYHLALLDLRGGQKLTLRLRRDGKIIPAALRLGRIAPPVPAKTGVLAPGLRAAYYPGRWKKLPDLRKLRPSSQALVKTPGLTAPPDARGPLAVRLCGYLAVPREGLYKFYLRGKCTGRLYLGGKVVVDTASPPHRPERRGLVGLKAGRYRIVVEFLADGTDKAGELLWEGPGFTKGPIPPAAVFHDRGPATMPAGPSSRPAR
ncbi:MAG: trypsin-like peptidase domain-containing protein [Planctomycetes bacterium]|nr:trypsin-like peptidase domain-containing protein [Planctomycetota bacterium]